MLPAEEFAALRAAWNDAEQSIKIAEQVTGKALIPSLNELRYAGRKIIDAADAMASDEAAARDLLRDARMDCLRAKHDAVDVSVGIIAHDVNLLLQRVGPARVSAVLPDIGDLIAKLGEAEAEIVASRGRRAGRDGAYEGLRDVSLPDLKRRYDQLRSSEPHLVAELKQERRWKIGSLAVGVVGLLIGIAGVLIALSS